jgi:hypothetical protein
MGRVEGVYLPAESCRMLRPKALDHVGFFAAGHGQELTFLIRLLAWRHCADQSTYGQIYKSLCEENQIRVRASNR